MCTEYYILTLLRHSTLSPNSVFVANAFMVTYLVMAAITIVNMFVAVILENYTQATEDVSEVRCMFCCYRECI